MTQPFDERGKELRELFFETTQELLQTLNDDSLKLEQSPGNQEIVRSIRRTVHTIKGDAAAIGWLQVTIREADHRRTDLHVGAQHPPVGSMHA